MNKNDQSMDTRKRSFSYHIMNRRVYPVIFKLYGNIFCEILWHLSYLTNIPTNAVIKIDQSACLKHFLVKSLNQSQDPITMTSFYPEIYKVICSKAIISLNCQPKLRMKIFFYIFARGFYPEYKSKYTTHMKSNYFLQIGLNNCNYVLRWPKFVVIWNLFYVFECLM